MGWRVILHRPAPYWQDRLKKQNIKWQWYHYIIPKPYKGNKLKTKSYKWLWWIIYKEI